MCSPVSCFAARVRLRARRGLVGVFEHGAGGADGGVAAGAGVAEGVSVEGAVAGVAQFATHKPLPQIQVSAE